MSSRSEPTNRRFDILFVTADQWRADHGPGRAPVPLPHIEALAKDGVAFRRHYTQAYPCGPARAGLHTGLYPHKHRSILNGTPLDARHPTVFSEARRGDTGRASSAIPTRPPIRGRFARATRRSATTRGSPPASRLIRS